LGRLTANTSTTNLSPTNLSHIAASNTKFKPDDTPSSNLDLSTPDPLARNELLLRNSAFADWDDHDPASSALDNPDELQKQDPLGTQIWKLYSRTKSRLPNQERMENLTWRMMAMNLRRREQQMQAQAAYEKNTQPGSDLRQAGADSLLSAKQTKIKSPPHVSAPSGIAQQLRKSVDQPVELELVSEPMNLDDFIVPSSIASPAGITSPAPTEGLVQNRATQGSAIRITPRNKPAVQIPMNLPPSSMPQSSVALNRSSEFDYVQRRVRKTSIDERRGVSFPPSWPSYININVL
jgi:GATA-binding protein